MASPDSQKNKQKNDDPLDSLESSDPSDALLPHIPEKEILNWLSQEDASAISG